MEGASEHGTWDLSIDLNIRNAQVADCRSLLRLNVHNDSFVEATPVPWTGCAGRDEVPVNGRFEAVNLALPMSTVGPIDDIAQ